MAILSLFESVHTLIAIDKPERFDSGKSAEMFFNWQYMQEQVDGGVCRFDTGCRILIAKSGVVCSKSRPTPLERS
jgi:hypothetical protein